MFMCIDESKCNANALSVKWARNIHSKRQLYINYQTFEKMRSVYFILLFFIFLFFIFFYFIIYLFFLSDL